MRKEISELQLALEGKIGEHHRFLLSVQLRRLWAAEKIYIVEQHIQETLKSYAAEILPGVDTAPAGAIIAELGRDMSVFENVSEPAFWSEFVRAATIGACLLIGTLLVYEVWPNLPRKMELSLATVVPDANSRIMTA